jgi:hypothetical protein
MPPRTVNVYSKELTVEAGAVLVPTDVLSNDDANIVRWMMIPFALAMPLLLLASKGTGLGSSLAQQAYGDGTVPSASTHPDPDKLSTPFAGAIQVHKKVTHKDLACDPDVISDVMKDISQSVLEFLAT